MSIKIANTVVISDTKDLDNLNNAEFEDNGFITLPSGNTAQRPVSPSGGMLRYNTDINDFEMYSNDEWTVFEEDTENLKDSIKYDEASVNVNFPALFQITDYDIEREYVLTSNTGTVTRDEDVITFTANTAGTAGFTINGREISIQSIDAPIAPAGAIAPYTGSLPTDGSWVDYNLGRDRFIVGASNTVTLNTDSDGDTEIIGGPITTNTAGSHTGSTYTYTDGVDPHITGTSTAGQHSHTVTPSSINADLKRKSYKLAKCVTAAPLPSNVYILSDSNLSGLSSVDVGETHMLLNSSSESSVVVGNNTISMTLTTNSAGGHVHGTSGTPFTSGDDEPYYWSDSSDGSHSHTTTYSDAGNDNTKKRTFSLWSDQSGSVGVISGSIMLWGSETPPAGWAICDGTNGTPDMRERYLAISNTASHGVSSGTNEVAFANLTTSSAGSHRHYSGEGGNIGDPTQSGLHVNFVGTHSHTINTFNARIRPKYHALHFIKKL